MARQVYDISWTSLWRVFVFFVIAIIAFFSKGILLSLFLAIVLSSGLEAAVTFLERRGLPRTLGVILIFVAIAIMAIALIYTIVPLLIIDINEVLVRISAEGEIPGLGPMLSEKTIQYLSEFVSTLSMSFFSGDGSPLSFFSQLLGGAGLVLTIFVTSFYLTITKDGVERFITAVLPARIEPIALNLYARSRKKMGSWFRAQLLLSIVVGLLVWAVLAILGVRHALLIGIISAIFEVIPFVGPVLAGGAAVFSALSGSVSLAMVTFVAFFGIQQLESNFLAPIFMRQSVGLHPVIVIVAFLIGIEMEGLLGGLVAIPAAAVLQEVVEGWSSARKSSVG